MTPTPDTTGPLTPRELGEMKRRCEMATEGPWFPVPAEFGRGGGWSGVRSETQKHDEWNEQEDPIQSCDGCDIIRDNDVQFIAHARTDLPRLIAEVERLAEVLQASVAENTRIRQEVAKLMVALDRGEIKMSMELMNQFYGLLGIEPPYPAR